MAAASGLPHIKCSHCGADIEITHLADHTCGSVCILPPRLPAMSRAEVSSRLAKADLSRPVPPTKGLLKPGRVPPPRIDAQAANTPYSSQREIVAPSAAASTPSDHASPSTPDDGHLSPLPTSRSALPMEPHIYEAPVLTGYSPKIDWSEPTQPDSPEHLASPLATGKEPEGLFASMNQPPQPLHSPAMHSPSIASSILSSPVYSQAANSPFHSPPPVDRSQHQQKASQTSLASSRKGFPIHSPAYSDLQSSPHSQHVYSDIESPVHSPQPEEHVYSDIESPVHSPLAKSPVFSDIESPVRSNHQRSQRATPIHSAKPSQVASPVRKPAMPSPMHQRSPAAVSPIQGFSAKDASIHDSPFHSPAKQRSQMTSPVRSIDEWLSPNPPEEEHEMPDIPEETHEPEPSQEMAEQVGNPVAPQPEGFQPVRRSISRPGNGFRQPPPRPMRPFSKVDSFIERLRESEEEKAAAGLLPSPESQANAFSFNPPNRELPRRPSEPPAPAAEVKKPTKPARPLVGLPGTRPKANVAPRPGKPNSDSLANLNPFEKANRLTHQSISSIASSTAPSDTSRPSHTRSVASSISSSTSVSEAPPPEEPVVRTKTMRQPRGMAAAHGLPAMRTGPPPARKEPPKPVEAQVAQRSNLMGPESPMDPAMRNGIFNPLLAASESDLATPGEEKENPLSPAHVKKPSISKPEVSPAVPPKDSTIAKPEVSPAVPPKDASIPRLKAAPRASSPADRSPTTRGPSPQPRAERPTGKGPTMTKKPPTKEPIAPVQKIKEPTVTPPTPQGPPAKAPAAGERPKTGVSKGICRGCNKDIFGKSVKASDGLLTGRYHKECFVCKTCHTNFPTGDFYVMNDFPYCAQHYHQLNDSLCAHCSCGIEGEYLEAHLAGSRQPQKFHPACFTCNDCATVLRDDFFEVGGQVYCERHANRAFKDDVNGGLAPPGMKGRKHPERRRTRLMMM